MQLFLRLSGQAIAYFVLPPIPRIPGFLAKSLPFQYLHIFMSPFNTLTSVFLTILG